MGLPTRSAASLTDYLTSYSENYLNTTPLNQAWTNTVVLDRLLGAAQEADGGNELVLPVMDGYTPAGSSYGAGSTLNIVHVNHVTQARYQFKQVYEPAYLDDVLMDKATGAGAKLRYVEGQLDRSKMAISESVALQLCAPTTGVALDGSPNITALLDIVKATGLIGGMNPSIAGQQFWQSFSNLAVGSFLTNGPGVMRTAYNAVTKYKLLGAPNVIFCSDVAYKAFETSGMALQTVFNTSGTPPGADLGIKPGGLHYKGIPLEYDPHLDQLEATLNGVMIWVNTKGVFLAPRAGKTFKVDPWVNMLPSGRKALGTVVTFVGELVCQARSPNAILAGITA
jgi:hypothetical protein